VCYLQSGTIVEVSLKSHSDDANENPAQGWNTKQI
jgi:hypothetical protein